MRLGDIEHYERIRAIAAFGGQPLHKSGGGYNIMNNSKLTTSVGDYREVEILSDSVIYCDVPYFQSREYKHNKEAFDHKSFYDWCEKQTALVLISEFWMPPERFVCIAERPRKSTFSATNNSLERIEKVFVPKHQYEMYKRMMSKNEQMTLDL